MKGARGHVSDARCLWMCLGEYLDVAVILRVLQRWERTGSWNDTNLRQTLSLTNRYGATPRNLMVKLLSDAMQVSC